MTETPALTPKGQTEQATPEQTRGGVYFSPQVDIYETDQELILLADVPGIKPEDVDLRFENGELIVHGRLKPRQQGRAFLVNEYGEGDFYRAFSVHESVDSSRITAECKNGVLTIHLPKAEPARPRKISVQGQ